MEKIRELQGQIELLEQKESILKSKKSVFKTETNDLDLEIKGIKKQVEELKEEIEKLAITNFKETNEKVFIGGIKVQETKSFDYDALEAFKWAKDHDMFLELDKKSFDKYIKALKPEMLPSFVKTVEGNRATFPKLIKLED